jgi:hypothetical protein
MLLVERIGDVTKRGEPSRRSRHVADVVSAMRSVRECAAVEGAVSGGTSLFRVRRRMAAFGTRPAATRATGECAGLPQCGPFAPMSKPAFWCSYGFGILRRRGLLDARCRTTSRRRVIFGSLDAPPSRRRKHSDSLPRRTQGIRKGRQR